VDAAITLTLDGTSYEIDLTAKNAAAFAKHCGHNRPDKERISMFTTTTTTRRTGRSLNQRRSDRGLLIVDHCRAVLDSTSRRRDYESPDIANTGRLQTAQLTDSPPPAAFSVSSGRNFMARTMAWRAVSSCEAVYSHAGRRSSRRRVETSSADVIRHVVARCNHPRNGEVQCRKPHPVTGSARLR
jgi:hypothetical protein